MWLLQSKGAEKANFSYRHAEFRAVKVEKQKTKKLGMIRPAHCSLSLLYSQERERKTHSSVFLFTTTNSSKGNPTPQLSGHGLQVPKPKRGRNAASSFRTAWRIGAQQGDAVGTEGPCWGLWVPLELLAPRAAGLGRRGEPR